MVKPEVAKKVAEGVHKTKITKIEERPITEKNKYHYFDVWVNVDGVDLKHGLPANITMDPTTDEPVSKLAKFLTDFGEKIDKEKDYTEEVINKLLVGKEVQIMTENKQSDSGATFANIVSFKPA